MCPQNVYFLQMAEAQRTLGKAKAGSAFVAANDNTANSSPSKPNTSPIPPKTRPNSETAQILEFPGDKTKQDENKTVVANNTNTGTPRADTTRLGNRSTVTGEASSPDLKGGAAANVGRNYAKAFSSLGEVRREEDKTANDNIPEGSGIGQQVFEPEYTDEQDSPPDIVNLMEDSGEEADNSTVQKKVVSFPVLAAGLALIEWITSAVFAVIAAVMMIIFLPIGAILGGMLYGWKAIVGFIFFVWSVWYEAKELKQIDLHNKKFQSKKRQISFKTKRKLMKRYGRKATFLLLNLLPILDMFLPLNFFSVVSTYSSAKKQAENQE